MDKVVLKNVMPYDGEYDIDTSYFTNREFHTIKRIAGVRAGELDEALTAGDMDVVVAVAVIALQRSGTPFDEDTLWDSKAGSIELIAGESEDDAGPPDLQPGSSGGASRPTSDPLANGQSPTGSQPSPTGATSDPATLAT